MLPSFATLIFFVVMGVYLVSSAIRILKEYERGVVFRLGRVIPVKGPGLVLVWADYRQAGENQPSHRDDGCSPAGHYYA